MTTVRSIAAALAQRQATMLSAAFLATLLLTAAGAHGQSLAGVAIGPDGRPLAETSVVLHRVGAGGGAFIGTTTTAADGGFRFTLEAADAAVYFAALRYEGAVYIGPAVEAGGEPISDYLLRVGPGSEAGAVASALAQPGPLPSATRPAAQGSPSVASSDAGAFALVGLMGVAAVAAFLFAAPRYRTHRTRTALIELAEAENSLADPGAAAADPDDTDAEDAEAGRRRLEATRDRLRKQLAPQS